MSDDEKSSNKTQDETEERGKEREQEKEQINEELVNPQATTDQLTNETQNKEFKFPKKRSIKQKQADEDPRIAEAFRYLRQTASQQRKDQCSLFGDYIADKLRIFDNHLRAIVQHRISNLLFELEMNLYQNSSTQSSTQSSFPIYSNFYPHTTHNQTQLYPHNQTSTFNSAFNDQFPRSAISAHHSTSPSDSSHFQTNRSSIQNSDNQPCTTSSTPVSYISSPYPSPQRHESPLSNSLQYFSDSTNDSHNVWNKTTLYKKNVKLHK